MEKKTVIIMCASVVGIIVAILLGIWIVSVVSPREYDYAEVEEMIVDATERYYSDNPVYLPTDDGKYNLSFSALTSGGYIKPLSELLENGDVCSANIVVVKNKGAFTYIPYLNCGDEYSTKGLANKIISDNEIVESGNGLYKGADNLYYFRGKVENNYVAFGSYEKKGNKYNYLWRIISIENDTIKLKAVEDVSKTVWDDRYNTTESNTVGYNDFDLSIFHEFLKDLETDFDNSRSDEVIDLSKLKATNLCIGPRESSDNISLGNIECNKLSSETYLYGTMTPYEYMRASLDSECVNLDSRACLNFNFLANDNQNTEWLITTTAKDNYSAYTFEGNIFNTEKAKYNRYVYPTIILNEFTFFESGTGSIDDPYIIK